MAAAPLRTQDRRPTSLRHALWCAGCAAVVLGGCGSGALELPDSPREVDGASPGQPVDETSAADQDAAEDQDEDQEQDQEEEQEQRDREEAELYPFSLPEGPLTPADVVEDDVYVPLQEGRCGDAQARLDAVWQDLDSPRSVLLYQAGVSACDGDDAAADWYAQAVGYGLDGLAVEFFVVGDQGQDVGTFAYDCELFRALTGVLHGVAPEETDCPGGDPPPWDDSVFPRVDPRTGIPAETGTGDDEETEEPEDTGDTEEPAPPPDDSSVTSAPVGG